MSTSVKHIHNGMRGAPVLSGTAGSLIAVLDALFVSGWGVTTAVSVSVSGGIATATLTSGHNFDMTSVILVAGATPSALNGEQRVTATDLTHTSWATTAPDGVATGTITIKYAPQTSWVKVYGATDEAVYRSAHVQSNGHYLYIKDSDTTSARVRGYESMTGVGVGVGPFPLDSQLDYADTAGGFIWKSLAANTTAVKYIFICDERFVGWAIAPGYSTNATYVGAPFRGFGDATSMSQSGDAYSTILSCSGSQTSGGFANQGGLDSQVASTAYGVCVAPRPYSGLGAPVRLDPRAFSGSIGNYMSGADIFLGSGPSAISGALHSSPVFLREQNTMSPPRLIVPGVRYIPQSLTRTDFYDGMIQDGAGDMVGRKLMVKATTGSYANTAAGFYLLDLTGPWR